MSRNEEMAKIKYNLPEAMIWHLPFVNIAIY